MTTGADIPALGGVATLFGAAACQSAQTAADLVLGPLKEEHLLVTMALGGRQGLAAYHEMTKVAFRDGHGSLGGLAFDLAKDTFEIIQAIAALVSADRGFLTRPIAIVAPPEPPHSDVVRSVEVTAALDLSFEGALVGAGAVIVYEYFRNGMVRVRIRGNVKGGAEYADGKLEGSATAGRTLELSWLARDSYEAARLTGLLTVSGAAAGSIALGVVLPRLAGGKLAPIPRPDEVKTGVDLTLGGKATMQGISVDAEAVGAADVTVHSDRSKSLEFSLSGAAGGTLSGAFVKALPGELSRRLEGSVKESVAVDFDKKNDFKQVSVSFEVSAATGTGVDVGAANASSTTGMRHVDTFTFELADLKQAGASGQRVIDALEDGRVKDALKGLEDLARSGTHESNTYGYTGVKGGVDFKGGGASTGGSAELGARFETSTK